MNFALLLLVLSVVTGVFYIAEKKKFLPERQRRANEAVRAYDQTNQEALQRQEPVVVQERERLYQSILRQPWWLEYTAGIFPVILIVFLFRSFLFEPFRIPSGSMLPTLHIGDFILVNKYEYGLRLPVSNTKIVPLGSPERGDVVVFRYPKDESIDYIKRVVGVPGDTVEYRNKVLYINGQEQKLSHPQDFFDESTMVTLRQQTEQLGSVAHMIAWDDRRPSAVYEPAVTRRNNTCVYNAQGFRCTVPEGQYFVLGDNRDNSEDSRYWGLVPDENLVGRAVFIWANFGDMSRIGSFE